MITGKDHKKAALNQHSNEFSITKSLKGNTPTGKKVDILEDLVKKSPTLQRALLSPSYLNSRGNKSVGKKSKREDKTSSILSEQQEKKSGLRKTDRLMTDRPSMASIIQKLNEAAYAPKKDHDSENEKNSNMSSLDISASNIELVNKSISKVPQAHSGSTSSLDLTRKSWSCKETNERA